MTLHHADSVVHVDGSEMFLRAEDRSRQDAIRDQIAAAWRVNLLYLGDLSFVDYLAVRDGRPVCWVEVISRSYDYETLNRMGGIFLKAATYDTLASLGELSLSIAWRGSCVVWDLLDGLYWKKISMDEPRIESTARDPRGRTNDVEQAVLVTGLRSIK